MGKAGEFFHFRAIDSLCDQELYGVFRLLPRNLSGEARRIMDHAHFGYDHFDHGSFT
jgi:hypothetical protein